MSLDKEQKKFKHTKKNEQKVERKFSVFIVATVRVFLRAAKLCCLSSCVIVIVWLLNTEHGREVVKARVDGGPQHP